MGFNQTLGVGGITGFVRQRHDLPFAKNTGGTSGYCASDEDFSVAPARRDLAGELLDYLREECASRFERYAALADYLDQTYQTKMAPFLRSLP